MSTKTLLSLATIALFAATAKATEYSVDERVEWFDENVATYTVLPTERLSGAAGGSYALEATDANNHYITLDTAATSPLFFTPANAFSTISSATKYRFDVTIKSLVVSASTASLPVYSGEGNVPYASIAAVETNDGNKWYGWDGNSWEALTSITAAPVEGSSYNVVIGFSVVSNQLKIDYVVDGVSHTLTHCSATALPSLTKIGFAGCGDFQNFSGSGINSVLEVTTTKTTGELEEAGLVVKAGQTVAQALNSTGNNGLPQWQSLVLGIDPSTTTKPYVKPVQNDSTANLTFGLGSYESNANFSDVTAKFDVYELVGPNDSTEAETSTRKTAESVAAGSTTTVPVPSTLKYYKIKITFEKTTP